MIEAVFVYADRHVGLMALPDKAPPPYWRRVKPQPLDWIARLDPVAITYEYEEFSCLGQMFDGRPVYCAEGLDVKEARMSALVTDEANAIVRVDERLRDEVSRLIRRTYPDATVLDEWHGDVDSMLSSQKIAKRGIRQLVAVNRKVG